VFGNSAQVCTGPLYAMEKSGQLPRTSHFKGPMGFLEYVIVAVGSHLLLQMSLVLCIALCS
jgi:hypothetical protein